MTKTTCFISILTFTLLLSTSGCCGDSSTTTTAANATEDDGAPEAKDDGPAKAKPNPKVVKFIDDIVAGCKIDTKYGRISRCKNKEESALSDWVRRESPTDLFETLGSIAVGGDAKKSAAAVSTTNSLFTAKDDKWKKKNATKAAMSSYFRYVKENKGSPAATMATYATHIAMMRGKHKKLFKLIESHKDKAVKTSAYRAYMTHGRLDGFKELKRVTKGSKDKDVILAALRAPRNMYKDTDKEKAAYCPWAKAYLKDKDLSIAAGAGNVLVKCQGDYIDELIDEGEKRVKAGEFKRPLSQVYREPCFAFIKNVTGKAGKKKQCDRLFGFLQDVADNKEIASDVRGMSLWNIYYQRRDQKSLDLMRKYENHKDPEVQKRAKEAIKSLTTTYKLK